MLDIRTVNSVILQQQPFVGERALCVRFSEHDPNPQYSDHDSMVLRLVERVAERNITTIQFVGNWYEQYAATTLMLAVDEQLRDHPYVDYDSVVYLLQLDNYIEDAWLDAVAPLRSAMIFVTTLEVLTLGKVNMEALAFVDHPSVHPESVYLRYPVSRAAPYSVVDRAVFDVFAPEQVYFTPMTVRHHDILQRGETARNVAFAVEMVQCYRAQLNLPAMEYLE